MMNVASIATGGVPPCHPNSPTISGKPRVTTCCKVVVIFGWPPPRAAANASYMWTLNTRLCCGSAASNAAPSVKIDAAF
jgi:hypothetical protein